MRMILEAEDRIRLDMRGEGFEVASEGASISPYHLLAGSLASCIALLEQSWAENAGVDWTGLEISVAWEFTDDHEKVGNMEATLHWPGLPESRAAAVERLAETCPVEETLRSGTAVTSRLDRN